MTKNPSGVALAAFLALALFPASATAAEPQSFAITRATSPVRIDGALDEAAWQQATAIPVDHEWFPGDGPAPVATVALVTYDDERLYVAFRAADPEPGKIRARFAERDAPTDDDTVGFFIDPFQDRPPGFPVPGQPPGRTDGCGELRRRGDRGLFLGCHLGVRGARHRGGLCRRGGPPVPAAPVPGHERRADLALHGHARMAPVAAPPHALHHHRSGPQLRRLPAPGSHRVPADGDRAQPRGHTHPHQPSLRGAGAAGQPVRRRRRKDRARGLRALGGDTERGAEPHDQPRLLAGRGRRRPARRQHALHLVLPGEAPLLPRRSGLLPDAIPARLHPHGGRSGRRAQDHRQAGGPRLRRLFRAGPDQQPDPPREPGVEPRLDRPGRHERGPALPPGPQQGVHARGAVDGPGERGLLQPRGRSRRHLPLHRQRRGALSARRLNHPVSGELRARPGRARGGLRRPRRLRGLPSR